MTFKPELMDKRIAKECLEVSEIDISYFVLFIRSLICPNCSFPSLPLNLPTSPLPRTYWFSISTEKSRSPIFMLRCKIGVTEIIFWPWNSSNDNDPDNVQGFMDWLFFVKFVV